MRLKAINISVGRWSFSLVTHCKLKSPKDERENTGKIEGKENKKRMVLPPPQYFAQIDSAHKSSICNVIIIISTAGTQEGRIRGSADPRKFGAKIRNCIIIIIITIIIIIIIIIIIRNLYSAIMPLGGYRGAGGTGR